MAAQRWMEGGVVFFFFFFMRWHHLILTHADHFSTFLKYSGWPSGQNGSPHEEEKSRLPPQVLTWVNSLSLTQNGWWWSLSMPFTTLTIPMDKEATTRAVGPYFLLSVLFHWYTHYSFIQSRVWKAWWDAQSRGEINHDENCERIERRLCSHQS